MRRCNLPTLADFGRSCVKHGFGETCIHNQTVSKGKPDGKKQFILLKEIIEMSWKTISMKSNIKTLRDAQPNSNSSSKNKSAHVADAQCDPEGDHGETYHQATTANKLYFACPIHKKDTHENGDPQIATYRHAAMNFYIWFGCELH